MGSAIEFRFIFPHDEPQSNMEADVDVVDVGRWGIDLAGG